MQSMSVRKTAWVGYVESMGVWDLHTNLDFTLAPPKNETNVTLEDDEMSQSIHPPQYL